MTRNKKRKLFADFYAYGGIVLCVISAFTIGKSVGYMMTGLLCFIIGMEMEKLITDDDND